MLHNWKEFTKLAGLLSSQTDIKGEYISFRPNTCSWAVCQNWKSNPSLLSSESPPTISRASPSMLPWLSSPRLRPWLTPSAAEIASVHHTLLQASHSSLVTQQTGQQESWTQGRFVCVCVCKREGRECARWGKDAAVWMSDSPVLITGFEGPALCHLWKLKGLLLLCERACGSGFSDFLIYIYLFSNLRLFVTKSVIWHQTS